MTLLRPCVVAAAAVAVLVLQLPAAAVGAAEPCDAAERLARFDLAAAREEYIELLESTTPPECALVGFPELGRKQREVAGLLAEADDEIALQREVGALERIARARALDPSNERAQQLLEELAAGAPPTTTGAADYAGAEFLLAAGYEDEARELARKVAAENRTEIPASLRSQPESLVAWMGDRTKDAGTVAGALAVAMALIVGLVASLLKLWRSAMRRRFVVLGTFTTFPNGKDEGVEKEDEKTKASGAMAPLPISGEEWKAVVAEELASASAASTTFKVVDASAVELPELLEVPEELKPLGKFVQILFRREVLTISATARAGANGDWHVTAQIAKRRGIAAQQRIEVPLAAGNDVHTVGVFTAAWAMCALRKRIGWELPWRRTYPFNTISSTSLAWVRMGASGGPFEVEKSLHYALSDDHRNAAALALLGGRQAWRPIDERHFRAGLEHLELAEKSLAARPTQRARIVRGAGHRANVQWEPLWFQIMYAQTSHRLHWHYAHPSAFAPRSENDLRVALDLALQLTKAIADTWLSVDGWWRRFAVGKQRRNELRQVLYGDAEFYLALLAGALVDDRGPPPKHELCVSLQGRALWKWVTRFDPARDLAQLITMVSKLSSHADGPTLYNIGCLCTRTGDYHRALDALTRSVDHVTDDTFDRMWGMLQNDATLQPLRDDPAHGPGFTRLLEDLKARAPKPAKIAVSQPVADRWVVILGP